MGDGMIGGGIGFAPFVVVGDDEIDIFVAKRFCFVEGGDAAVDGDDEFGAGVGELFEGFGVEAVAFFEALGDVVVDVAAEEGDGVPEDGGGGDAVDVVVAVDDDFFLVADGLVDALGGFEDAGEEGGLMEMVEAGGEEGRAVGGAGDAAIEEDLGDEGGGFEAGRQLGGGGRGRCDSPSLDLLHPCVLTGIVSCSGLF